MAKVNDDTTKKILLMTTTPTGKTKILGFYKKVTDIGDVFMVPHEHGVFGSIGRQFDSVEYMDTYYHARARSSKAGVQSTHYLEYGKS